MQDLKERMAYIMGLTAGLNVDQNSAEGRILIEVLDLLDDVIRSLDTIHVQQNDLEEYVAAIDEDLTDLENDFYDEYNEEEDDVQLYSVYGSTEAEDDDVEYLEIECPNCKQMVFVDSDLFEADDVAEVLCPECNETILVNEDVSMST
ncbi:CD1247 N-terminal domain-containing protein [Effusibacillus dendaii]|uniref:AraC family transcriptional regulator n=1 Tax=Effusibacillus dendaii TaxID=2743772 RepID=A0A7I8DDG3_9BACL|nr:CD1247 N-terminal domain-containing protein [Effusibacillus dendaii]BCJ85931.1 hypothetical protein skT53_09160 [Effusibacillus dendaii]